MIKKRFISILGILLVGYWLFTNDVSVHAISRGFAAESEKLSLSKSSEWSKPVVTAQKSLLQNNDTITEKNSYAENNEIDDDGENYLQAKKVFCLLKRSPSTVPKNGDVRISYSTLGENGEFGSYAMVWSPVCPKDMYSMVKFNKDQKIEKQIDCRKTNQVQLSLELQRQWSILEAPTSENELNLALAGPGYFPTFCPGKGFKLTRSGRFNISEAGNIIDSSGCFLWSMPSDQNPQGGPFTSEDADLYLSEGFDEYGCLSNNRCLGPIDPLAHDIAKMNYNDSVSIWTDLDLKKLSPDPGSKIYKDAIEDLENPLRGPTGWENPEFWIPMNDKTVCDDF